MRDLFIFFTWQAYHSSTGNDGPPLFSAKSGCVASYAPYQVGTNMARDYGWNFWTSSAPGLP